MLLKLKPGVTDDQVSEIANIGKGLVGIVDGLQRIELGPPAGITAKMAKGFDLGLLAILDKEEQILPYLRHPEHQN